MSLNSSCLKTSVLLGAVVVASGCSSSSKPRLGVGYDDVEKRILVTYSRSLEGSETLHSRVRQGDVGSLDCARELGQIRRIDDRPVATAKKPTWMGPQVQDHMFEGIYTTEWLEQEPTPEMLAQAEAGEYIIDVCLMDGTEVVQAKAFDIREAKDNAGSDGKFDGEAEERIASTTAYAELCVAELGEIPFFEKLGDGDYATYNCLDSTPIPMTVTDENGNVAYPESEQSQCDNPQYIYSSCEPNAVDGRTNGPRVASRTNEQGTSWVLLCRKAKTEEGSYNDIAMIGTNPYTGKTCYFQNALYSRTDGLNVPHPADKTASDASPQESATLWQGIHGGIGSGIECAKCHSTDAFIHTPWIDGAKNEAGETIVPKMGEHDDFVLGYNDGPYSIINRAGQGWTMPKHIVDQEAAACTKCHRIGAEDRWSGDWMDRMVGLNTAWTNLTTPEYRKFEHTFWMPPEVDGLDESTWEDSEYGKAMKFIMDCQANPESCTYAELPTNPIGDGGSLPEIELEGRDLAVAALAVLGADVDDPSCAGGNCESRRCAECHSVSRSGLKRWNELTDDAWETCGLKKAPADMTQEEALRAVNCLRVDPNDTGSVFEAAKLGILTTGVQYTDFRRLFQKAYGEDGWLMPYAGFKARVGMPKGSHPKLSQKEYATLIKWFQKDLPNLDEVLREPPPPETCTEDFSSSALAAHIDEMKYEGWQAINEENGIRMFGCTPGAGAQECFSKGGFTMKTSWGNGAENGIVRELAQFNFRTSFWTRSSADGRYVGNGGGSEGATITDLQEARDIGVDASYDPGFFPDNSGFIFQGATGGAGICSQSMLATDDLVDFSEEQCMNARGVNLYQHVARGTGGGDYFIINSQFTSDSGNASSDPRAHFNARSTMKFTPMIFNGTTYEQLDETIVDSPYEGDSVLSPSGKLVISRLSGPGGVSLGYVIRKVSASKFGDRYNINIDQKVATICASGAKANISYDERFVVTHSYRDGKSDLFLWDLLTGEEKQITNVPAGAYAMFPHFRSDGWIYFLMDDGEHEYVAASDAAIRMAN